MRKSNIAIGIIIILIIAVLVIIFIPKNKEETVKIGFIGPLTGDGSTIGQNVREATELYLEEFPLKRKTKSLMTTFEVA